MLGRKQRVLPSNGPCYIDCWHTGFLLASLIASNHRIGDATPKFLVWAKSAAIYDLHDTTFGLGTNRNYCVVCKIQWRVKDDLAHLSIEIWCWQTFDRPITYHRIHNRLNATYICFLTNFTELQLTNIQENYWVDQMHCGHPTKILGLPCSAPPHEPLPALGSKGMATSQSLRKPSSYMHTGSSLEWRNESREPHWTVWTSSARPSKPRQLVRLPVDTAWSALYAMQASHRARGAQAALHGQQLHDRRRLVLTASSRSSAHNQQPTWLHYYCIMLLH